MISKSKLIGGAGAAIGLMAMATAPALAASSFSDHLWQFANANATNVIDFQQGSSKIFNDNQLYINTDDWMILNAGQQVVVSNNLGVGGNTRTDSLSVVNGATVGTTLAVTGDATVGGNATVTGNVTTNGLLVLGEQTLTIASDGAGTVATKNNFVPTSSYVAVTCNDTDGCNLKLNDAVEGSVVYIINEGSNILTLSDGGTSADGTVLNLSATHAMGLGDTLTLIKGSSVNPEINWNETAFSNN